MSGVLIYLLVGCLLHDALCQQFAAFMPQSMEVLTGSCLTIPCSFKLPQEYNNDVDSTCAGIWKIGAPNGDDVFGKSFRDGPFSSRPRLTGTLTGDLTNKNCTTILNNMDSSYSGDYYFRLQCQNRLRYNFEEPHLKVLVKEAPPRPTLTPDPVNVAEGTSVTLRCSAAAPCSSLPPTLTWTPRLADTEEMLLENEDQTKVLVSSMTFTASPLHHGQEISCAVSYKRQTGNRDLSSSANITVHVQMSPKLSSECLSQGQMRVSCSWEGDSVQYSWTLDGQTLTDEQLLCGHHDTQNITLIQGLSGQLSCSVRNTFSSDAVSENISPCGGQSVYFYFKVAEMCVLLMVCVGFYIYYKMKTRPPPPQDPLYCNMVVMETQ